MRILIGIMVHNWKPLAVNHLKQNMALGIEITTPLIAPSKASKATSWRQLNSSIANSKRVCTGLYSWGVGRHSFSVWRENISEEPLSDRFVPAPDHIQFIRTIYIRIPCFKEYVGISVIMKEPTADLANSLLIAWPAIQLVDCYSPHVAGTFSVCGNLAPGYATSCFDVQYRVQQSR